MWFIAAASVSIINIDLHEDQAIISFAFLALLCNFSSHDFLCNEQNID